MIDKNRFKYLKQYIKKCVNNGVFPGACFGIVTREESQFGAEGYLQLLPTKELVDINTIYDLASLSKVISTTTIILKLIEDGQITLCTNVCDILPNFKHKDVTIYNLLTHTSGLPADIDDYKILCKNKQDIIKSVFSMELEYKTGQKVLYSDIGYILLGLIIERVAGPIDVYFSENISKPLNMKDTCYNPKDNLKNRCAATEYKNSRGYIRGTVHDGKAHILEGVSGHAGLFSTVKDLGKFCRMMLNKGILNDKRILSENSIKMIMEYNTDGLNEKRGLGWQVKNNLGYINSMGDLSSRKSIFHTGFTGTSVLIDFENQFAFILLTNRIHPSRDNIGLIKLRRNINNIAETVVFKKV
ncbi:serine hydrolase domain-containing protein [Clostridium ljungdahlii]|uniref:Penicillin-binding protein 4 n=1 Tax=Clostridium ljungdahlii TaxID=1538 RepID=A0A168LEM4_9CLOT|nr:serine hydrolase [Clostridium ljungdahlii]OAA83057.1 Penicillin-binding protein 4* [Clostridium ljungdahlii]